MWISIKKTFRNSVFNIPSRIPANIVAELEDSNELCFYMKIISENIFEIMTFQTNISFISHENILRLRKKNGDLPAVRSFWN